jgi:hypothetical protein
MTELAAQALESNELRVDVSAELPFEGPTYIAASIHLPDPGTASPPAVLICWPGGSYSRAYWDMHIPDHPGYSFARHMTARGFVVVAADHLGVGDSSRPADGDRVDFDTMSAAAAAFVKQIRAMRLGGRTRAETPIVGVGHSLGACLTVVTQARHRCYDAVALLGFTHGAKELAVSAVGGSEDGAAADGEEALRASAAEQARAFFGDSWDDVYGDAPRAPNHPWLYRPDVPAAVIAADDATAARWPRQAYVEALLRGHSARFAADLDCSVFLGFGDHDIPPEPHADVAFYPRSSDVTLYVLRNSAHCHNFASTRALLWDRIGAWAAAQGRDGDALQG